MRHRFDRTRIRSHRRWFGPTLFYGWMMRLAAEGNVRRHASGFTGLHVVFAVVTVVAEHRLDSSQWPGQLVESLPSASIGTDSTARIARSRLVLKSLFARECSAYRPAKSARSSSKPEGAPSFVSFIGSQRLHVPRQFPSRPPKTTTAKGLKVTCRLDRRKYPTGRKVSREEMKRVHMHPDKFHGEWNYFKPSMI